MIFTCTPGQGGRAFAVAACALVLAMGCAAAFAESAIVKVAGGTLRGEMHEGMRVFRGIPYAEPPLGALRWRPPQPVRKWKGVRAADHWAPECMQPVFPGDLAPSSQPKISRPSKTQYCAEEKWAPSWVVL